MENHGHSYGYVLSSPTEETLPPYSTTWAQDTIEKEPEKSKSWNQKWNWKQWWATSPWLDTQQQRAPTYEAVSAQANVVLSAAWKFLVHRGRVSAAQWTALVLVGVFGIAPFVILAKTTISGPRNHIFYGLFEDKVLNCGSSFGTPENATVTGIEKVFALDKTFGRFSFSAVKTIDVAWDIIIGRGVQLIAWWIGYVVFSDALLRAIERHPTSFQIFQRVALEGPSLLSLWTLLCELCRSKSKRTKALFFYMWISTLYIISIPMFIGAMTGYDSTSIAWVSLDDSNNIVPADNVKNSGYVTGTRDKAFAQPVCIDYDDYNRVYNELSQRRGECDCRIANGTIVKAADSYRYFSGRNNGYTYNYLSTEEFATICRWDFANNTQTFQMSDSWAYRGGKTQKCGTSWNVTLSDQQYDVLTLNVTYGLCYDNKPFRSEYLRSRTRCLPDTANPSYEWGFSTIISGIFVFLHFGWTLTMYIIWQDAQFGSTLVKNGYQMTPLRAAFAMAKAAQRKTGMSEKRLVRANTKELEQELYGTRRTTGTKVGIDLFDEADEEHGEEHGVRRRHARPTVVTAETEISIDSVSTPKPVASP